MTVALVLMGVILSGFWLMLGWLAHDLDELKKTVLVIYEAIMDTDK